MPNKDFLARACRYAHLWMPGYMRDRWVRRKRPPCRRVWVTIADHYEPRWGDVDHQRAVDRVHTWLHKWPEIATRFHDSAGRPAKYTFFYPQEEYHEQLLDPLAEMTAAGVADVEVHLHHDGEGEQNFMDRMVSFLEVLHHRHDLLHKENGRLTFGFIHGNWALDNSGPDGRHCGLNNELQLLKRLGCYADFTFPVASHPAQPRLVNTIYWGTDDPVRPKSYDTGVPLTPGGPVAGDLLMVPGPLAVYTRRGDIRPHIEIGELAEHNPVTPQRIALWLDSAPSIGGDVFIKLFAHGAQERNATPLLNRDLPSMFEELLRLSRISDFEVYFVTAWEMWKAIDALRCTRDPVALLSDRQAQTGDGVSASVTGRGGQ